MAKKRWIKALACAALFASVSSFGCADSFLYGCGSGKSRVVIFGATEEERIQFLTEELNKKFPEYDVVFQYVGTGELFSKLQGEKKNIQCDIVFDVETCNFEYLIKMQSDLFFDLNDFDYSIYTEEAQEFTSRHKKYALCAKFNQSVLVNKAVLAEKNLEIPSSYQDLLKPAYKNQIMMPNPKSSGTGYCFYNGVMSAMGTTDGLSYFRELTKNMKEYTSSGSVPTKSVDRGDVAIGIGMLWQQMLYKNQNDDLEVVFLDNQSAYTIYGMGVINGHQNKLGVYEVFSYLFNVLNKECVETYTPDKVYADQGEAKIPNYPTNFTEIDMQGLYDFSKKQELLDLWTF